MRSKRFIVMAVLAATLASLAPSPPASADQAAVWRNIFILGAGAATVMTINHNKQVHAKYAAYDRQVAESNAERNDAWAAYRSEKAAYENEAAVASSLEREVAFQHTTIVQLRRQLALDDTRNASFVATTLRTVKEANKARTVAAISYGWGTI